MHDIIYQLYNERGGLIEQYMNNIKYSNDYRLKVFLKEQIDRLTIELIILIDMQLKTIENVNEEIEIESYALVD